MFEAVALHWVVEMLATFMYIGLLSVCTNPKHNHNKLMMWVGNHRLLTQAVLAIPMAWLTVSLIDATLLEHVH